MGIELSGQLKAQLFWHFRGSPRIKTRKWDWAVSGGLSRTLPVSFIGDKKIMIINVFLVVMRKLWFSIPGGRVRKPIAGWKRMPGLGQDHHTVVGRWAWNHLHNFVLLSSHLLEFQGDLSWQWEGRPALEGMDKRWIGDRGNDFYTSSQFGFPDFLKQSQVAVIMALICWWLIQIWIPFMHFNSATEFQMHQSNVLYSILFRISPEHCNPYWSKREKEERKPKYKRSFC